MDKQEIIKNINGAFWMLLIVIGFLGLVLLDKLNDMERKIEDRLKNIETHQQQKK